MLRRLFRLLVVLSVVAILAVVAVWALTNTDTGRKRVRRYALESFGGATHGIVRLGALHGNLLSGATFAGVSIVDSAGRPFLVADSVSARYGIRSFFARRIQLSDVVLYRPHVVVERLPGADWNYRLLWPQLGAKGAPGDTLPGFGSWVRFDNMAVHKGDVVVRSPWEPREGLSNRVRDSVITAALGDQSRLKIIRVPGGFQKVVALDSIDAIVPQLRISDPAFRNRLAVVKALRMIAYPFREPGARVTALTGNFEFNDDSLWWKGVKAQLPGSKLSGDGIYRIDNGDMRLSLAAAPAAVNDFRWIMPTLPKSGGGRLGITIQWKGATQDYVLRDADVITEGARLRGDIGFTLTDTVYFHDADVRFAGLTFKLINDVFPGTGTPRPGVMTGAAKFSGTLHRLRIAASDVTYDAYGRGRNRFIASGIIGFRGKPTIVSANDLRVRIAPLQVDLVKLLFPTLPIGGTLSGVATLNGDGARQLVATGLDIVHQDGPNRTHAVGRASVHTTGRQTLDLDVQAQPLALAELNKFAPTLGLKGLATGPIHAHGPIDAVVVDTRLAVPGGATFGMRGTVDFLSKELGYDVAIDAARLDLSRVMAGAPSTSFTGSGTARGRGFKPATMYADLAFDFGPSSVDTIGLDSLTIRGRLANGVATVARAQARGAGAQLDLAGSFGLDARHRGALTYSVVVDSLATFARFIPGASVADTGVMRPRPRITAERLARARADSARVALATEVVRAISGRPPPRVQVDTPTAIPRRLLAGSLRAAGTITGSVARFNLQGTGSGTGLVIKGNSARHLGVTYSWNDARTAQSKVAVALSADTITAFGFAFDSLAGDLSYLKPGGTVSLRVRQGNQRDYALAGDFTLDKARNELRLADLSLRFDTTTWRSTHAAAIRWGPPGIEVVNLELRSGGARRIYANGLLPTEGRANFDLAVTDFAIENVAELLQSDIPLTGRVTLDAHVQGTAVSPVASGRIDLVHATYNGAVVPDIRGTFDYANRQLTTTATAVDSTGRRLASVNGTIPVDLTLAGVPGSRLLDAPISVSLASDSLPVGLIPQFTDVVTDVGGRANGNFTVGGTLRKPVLRGTVVLSKAQFKLAATGAFFQNVNGAVHMTGDTVYVDSVSAVANGPLKLTGTIAVGKLARPEFNLFLIAEDAQLLNNESGDIHANAGLRVSGPLDKVYVSGQVTVLHGVLYVPSGGKRLVNAGDPALFNVIDTAIVSQREIFPAQSPLFKNLRVDVDLAVERNTWVRSKEANVEIFTEDPLRVSVAGDALTLLGAVDADRGEYTFLSKRFQITRGSALFIGTPELNPTVQVTAEYQVKQVTGTTNIKVLVGGTLEQPRVSLESDAQPPLTQSELLSYLAFGESNGSLLQAAGGGSLTATQGGNVVGAAGQRFAGIALGVFFDDLEGNAARSLGFDVFNVTPGSVPFFNNSSADQFLKGTEFEVGKYISPTTFVSGVATPGAIACLGGSRGSENSSCTVPGLTLVHRTNKGYRFETSFVPHYFLNPPTLAGQTASGGAQFGAFIIREWRF